MQSIPTGKEMKKCSTCKRSMPYDAFYTTKNRLGQVKYRANCKDCHIWTVKKWIADHAWLCAIYKKRYRDKQSLKD